MCNVLASHRSGLLLLVFIYTLPFYLLNMEIIEGLYKSEVRHIAKNKQNEK